MQILKKIIMCLLGINSHTGKPDSPMEFTASFPEYKKHRIGVCTYGRPEVIDWGEGAHLEIGNYCSIGGGVTILLGGNHNTERVTSYPLNLLYSPHRDGKTDGCTKGNVVIGNDVWIGRKATILSGVTIGDGAVIGTEAVVAKSVAPYSVVVGNPGREVRKRFDDDTIGKLLKIRWWEWDSEKIHENMKELISTDMTKFLKDHAVPQK